jgi:hypothetical protein
MAGAQRADGGRPRSHAPSVVTLHPTSWAAFGDAEGPGLAGGAQPRTERLIVYGGIQRFVLCGSRCAR